MARIAIVTGAASSIGQALATRNGRKVGVALMCLPAGCALALRDPGRSPVERPGRDAYRLADRFYHRVFGGLNAGLRGLGLKMFPAHEGMDVLDVGCGTGLQLACYQRAGCRVSGIEPRRRCWRWPAAAWGRGLGEHLPRKGPDSPAHAHRRC